jgi:hypothetical protein
MACVVVTLVFVQRHGDLAVALFVCAGEVSWVF